MTTLAQLHDCHSCNDERSLVQKKKLQYPHTLDPIVPSPSDGRRACFRRCQLALDLTVRGTGHLHFTPALSGRLQCGWCCFVFAFEFVASLATTHPMFLWLFHPFVADRRATARTTVTLSHAASSQKKLFCCCFGLCFCVVVGLAPGLFFTLLRELLLVADLQNNWNSMQMERDRGQLIAMRLVEIVTELMQSVLQHPAKDLMDESNASLFDSKV